MVDGKKILLVEDDAYTRDIYKDVLEEAGFEVTLATDGQEGLVKLDEDGFALVLLDVMMPKLDGIGFLKAVKYKPPKDKQPKICLLTNLGHDPVIQEAISLGASGFLIKSDLNPDQLAEKVKQMLH